MAITIQFGWAIFSSGKMKYIPIDFTLNCAIINQRPIKEALTNGYAAESECGKLPNGGKFKDIH